MTRRPLNRRAPRTRAFAALAVPVAPVRRTLAAAAALATLAACTDDPLRPTVEHPPRDVGAVAAPNPPGASVPVTVQVPAGMRTPPFNVTRTLTVPPNFAISVFARVAGARFLAVAPNGDLFVSRPSAGRIMVLRPGSGSTPQTFTYASGLNAPHDLVFHTIGGTTYLYVAESNRVARYRYVNGDVSGRNRQVLITGLPTGGHNLKNIALRGSKLYVSVASSCNVCTSDRTMTPQRAAIHVHNADGTGGRVYARGLRNAEGLAFPPWSSTLWVVVNGRDNTPYPFHNDWDGDGQDDFGRVIQSYVDDHPPELFTSVRDGGDYGWPYCNHSADAGYDDLPLDDDWNFNRFGGVNCAAKDRAVKGIQGHSAPLGLTFVTGTSFPAAYRPGVVVALHGSWNRSVRNGTKLVYFGWDAAAGRPGAEIDLVRGWLVGGNRWGRPVDQAVAPDGSLYISDDMSGTVYRLTYTSTP
jgi:glucose/arabinose dehydrogenase